VFGGARCEGREGGEGGDERVASMSREADATSVVRSSDANKKHMDVESRVAQ
jgi:hypothetical protein